jgi:hypothetical protein
VPGGNVVAYGYRIGEVRLPAFGRVKSDVRVSSIKPINLQRRIPVQVSLGPIVFGAACPHADPIDPFTMLAGVAKRFARETPIPDPGLLNDFMGYVHRKIRKWFIPLPPDTDLTVETWLSEKTYPQSRKNELMAKWNEIGGFAGIEALDAKGRRKFTKCKSFMKDEVYPEYKHPRAINSRTDEYKCAVGPTFSAIEKVVFKRPEFIKRIPVRDRPKYIMERLFVEGADYDESDYTSYEALFIAIIMEICEFQLFDYMTEHLPIREFFYRTLRRDIAGENVCVFKLFTVFLQAIRMSGEMDTSLANGFANYMFMKFMCKVKKTKVKLVVEGDDSGNRITITTQPGAAKPTEADFARLGLIIKLENHLHLEEMSFCGLIFDRVDQLNVTDPRDVLATFGWTTNRYYKASSSKKLGLLRCKALSMAYQYPGCPIIASLARYGMRVTRSHDVRHLIANWRNTWEREQLQEALEFSKHSVLEIATPMNTRLLVEKKYGIDLETQLSIEKYIDSLDVLQPLDHELILMIMNPIWLDYWNKYVLPDHFGDYPGEHWVQSVDFQMQNPLFYPPTT